VELTPRTAPDVRGAVTARRRRSPWAYGVLALVVLGLGVVVYQGLTSASLYFYNADEAVDHQADLGEKRFRLQGTVQSDSIEPTGEGVDFTVAFNGVDVAVQHAGDPPELFEPGVPVVLEGRWDPSGDVFDSDRILVKHSEQYQADNGDRIDDAEDGQTGDAGTSATAP
jgi:cytochrome c-type biogenesis protein CcmE